MTFFKRSCVIGRGVVTFSICSAMALASNTPTQIGRTRCPSLSRRMMMGMLVMGSTIKPLIVISICISPFTLVLDALNVRTGAEFVKHGFPAQAVWIRAGDPDRNGATEPLRLARQVDDGVAA